MQASEGLSLDPGARTNELVSNLTEIIVQLSGVDPASLTISSPVVFEPDPPVVRQNVFWSLSLIVSVRHCFVTHSSCLHIDVMCSSV